MPKIEFLIRNVEFSSLGECALTETGKLKVKGRGICSASLFIDGMKCNYDPEVTLSGALLSFPKEDNLSQADKENILKTIKTVKFNDYRRNIFLKNKEKLELYNNNVFFISNEQNGKSDRLVGDVVFEGGEQKIFAFKVFLNIKPEAQDEINNIFNNFEGKLKIIRDLRTQLYGLDDSFDCYDRNSYLKEEYQKAVRELNINPQIFLLKKSENSFNAIPYSDMEVFMDEYEEVENKFKEIYQNKEAEYKEFQKSYLEKIDALEPGFTENILKICSDINYMFDSKITDLITEIKEPFRIINSSSKYSKEELDNALEKIKQFIETDYEKLNKYYSNYSKIIERINKLESLSGNLADINEIFKNKFGKYLLEIKYHFGVNSKLTKTFVDFFDSVYENIKQLPETKAAINEFAENAIYKIKKIDFLKKYCINQKNIDEVNSFSDNKIKVVPGYGYQNNIKLHVEIYSLNFEKNDLIEQAKEKIEDFINRINNNEKFNDFVSKYAKVVEKAKKASETYVKIYNYIVEKLSIDDFNSYNCYNICYIINEEFLENKVSEMSFFNYNIAKQYEGKLSSILSEDTYDLQHLIRIFDDFEKATPQVESTIIKYVKYYIDYMELYKNSREIIKKLKEASDFINIKKEFSEIDKHFVKLIYQNEPASFEQVVEVIKYCDFTEKLAQFTKILENIKTKLSSYNYEYNISNEYNSKMKKLFEEFSVIRNQAREYSGYNAAVKKFPDFQKALAIVREHYKNEMYYNISFYSHSYFKSFKNTMLDGIEEGKELLEYLEYKEGVEEDEE